MNLSREADALRVVWSRILLDEKMQLPDDVRVRINELFEEAIGEDAAAGGSADSVRAALVAARPYLMPTREAVTDEDVEDFCREAWPRFYDWDQRTQAVFRRTARRALELPLPVLPTREEIVVAIGDALWFEEHPERTGAEINGVAADAVLALLNGES
jgi:hypothetical protein